MKVEVESTKHNKSYITFINVEPKISISHRKMSVLAVRRHKMENITNGGEIVTSSTIPSIEEIIKITKKT